VACAPRRLIPGTETKAQTVGWVTGDTFKLEAPILNFTIQEVLDSDFRARVAEVLKFWIDYDVENLFRIKSGIHLFRVPGDYETNATNLTGWVSQGGPFREESFDLACGRLAELLGLITTHYYQKKDIVSATIYAMALKAELARHGVSEQPQSPDDAQRGDVAHKHSAVVPNSGDPICSSRATL
jgi:hypothetical protein